MAPLPGVLSGRALHKVGGEGVRQLDKLGPLQLSNSK